MTVKELKEKLSLFDDDMEVFMAERKTEFTYGLVNGVYIKEIGFMFEPDGDIISDETVVVLDEE